MLDIDTEEALIKKVGGKFALTTLFQRRIVELNRGAHPMVKVDGYERSLRKIVCQEILEDKVMLSTREQESYEVAAEQQRIETAAQVAPPAPPAKADEAEIYGSDIKKIKEERIKQLAQMLNPKK
jgi:DNA-directed RNA polymerase subunit omega